MLSAIRSFRAIRDLIATPEGRSGSVAFFSGNGYIEIDSRRIGSTFGVLSPSLESMSPRTYPV